MGICDNDLREEVLRGFSTDRLRQELERRGVPVGSLKYIQIRHYGWVERMGWHNKTVLEALALIASEVGEAVNECRGEKPTSLFGEELADIILRVADLAEWQGIDLEKEIEAKMEINEDRGTRGRRI